MWNDSAASATRVAPLGRRERRQAVADVLRHGQVRKERELLEHVADAGAAGTGTSTPARRRTARDRRRDAAGVGPGEPGDAAQEVVLPEPEAPNRIVTPGSATERHVEREPRRQPLGGCDGERHASGAAASGRRRSP